jgi:hypothetical protein
MPALSHPERVPAPTSCATRPGATTTNSIRDTVCPAYRLIIATYRGANACNSRFHAASATSTRKIPAANVTARVRSATAEPHTNGQANTGASFRGTRRMDPATTPSRRVPACSNSTFPETNLMILHHQDPAAAFDSSTPPVRWMPVEITPLEWKFSPHELHRCLSRRQVPLELCILYGIQDLTKFRSG